MKRAPIIAALATTVALPALAMDAVSDVDVSFDVAEVNNPAAAQFWGELETDLESAILSRVTDRTDALGTEIEIDINEFDLSQSMVDGMTADAVLVGDIDYVQEMEAEDEDEIFESETQMSYRLRVVAGAAASDGSSEPEIYQAMVDRFAENVVSKLQ